MIRKLIGILKRNLTPARTNDGGANNRIFRVRGWAVTGKESHNLHPATNPGTARELPRSVVAKPNVYRIGEEVFQIIEPGIYRFYSLNNIAEQRIIAPPTIDELLSYIGFLWCAGNLDNSENTSADYWLHEASQKIVCAGCSQISFLAKAVFSACNFQSRIVAGITSDKWGGWDDGHTLIEVKSDDRWILYDPSMNCCFQKKGKLIGLNELADCINTATTFEVDLLAGNRPQGPWRVDGRDLSFWVLHRTQINSKLIQWYKHVLEIPLYYDGANFQFTSKGLSESNVSRLAKKYKQVSDEKWDNIINGR